MHLFFYIKKVITFIIVKEIININLKNIVIIIKIWYNKYGLL